MHCSSLSLEDQLSHYINEMGILPTMLFETYVRMWCTLQLRVKISGRLATVILVILFQCSVNLKHLGINKIVCLMQYTGRR